ncbi:hypothetical protein LMG27952_00793 [Paraburkholderia hiiakae]|uniref:Restriction endonuclease n=1 Tax=Paraburkholderia hiiakae TaxID=1081782 RepID=A0ABM8NBJ2_9BURK|nr:hypothetical protein [Paraburkholderia hiiakae]CAD6513844.1 hypothetical protein LMG27952_00793 [Paraburkholderia hiiakae]
MKWFVNDLSLQRQFGSDHEFLGVLQDLLRLRHKSAAVAEGLHCSKSLREAPVTAHSNFREAVQKSADQNLRRAVLEWVASKGPFWEDSRAANADDYFEVQTIDATDTGAGEAARQILIGAAASTYSFQGAAYDYSPLRITHGLSEAPLGQLDVTNVWTVDQLLADAHRLEAAPQNWEQVIERAKRRFDRLAFSSNISEILRGEPFIPYVVERLFELLRVLQEFVESRNADGTYSTETQRLINEHFSGEKAWFSGESDGNENDFRSKLTFRDSDDGEDHFCPWHGKIKTPQFRVHFPWPMESAQKTLKIFYIGPKITKK